MGLTMQVFVLAIVAAAIFHEGESAKKPWDNGNAMGKDENWNRCQGNGDKIDGFGSRGYKDSTHFPCKYDAVRLSTCGDWSIDRLTPGNGVDKYQYRFMTMWFGVVKNNKKWEGRSSLKMCAKYMNQYGSNAANTNFTLFQQKNQDDTYNDGVTAAQNLAEMGMWEGFNATDEMVYIRSDSWILKMGCYDPAHEDYSDESMWSFECYPNVTLDLPEEGFFKQMCGGHEGNSKTPEMKTHWGKGVRLNETALGLTNSSGIMAYKVFTATPQFIVQTNPECKEAVDIVNGQEDNLCYNNETHKVFVLNSCWEILNDFNITRCVTQYSCGPMEVFNKCLAFGCNYWFEADKKQKTSDAYLLCREIAESIDNCPALDENLGVGGLSAKINSLNCYEQFRIITYNA